VPDANPPFQSIDVTLGFHCPHVDMSDQIFQTLSAGAFDSTAVPYSAITRLPSRYPDVLPSDERKPRKSTNHGPSRPPAAVARGAPVAGRRLPVPRRRGRQGREGRLRLGLGGRFAAGAPARRADQPA